jgi:2-oxo-4-hydroxy-4-carboxy--5-ureidoimidazoline (OHCU) decarboxylase
VRDLPRQLSVEELADLFEGRTRFVERLAQLDDPLRHAREVAAALSDEEKKEVLDAHPAIGATKLSARSASEQGSDEAPELDELNRAYEEKFGFRFVVFVNRRPKSELVPILRDRLVRTREEELATALDELVAIAEDRWRRS